MSETSSDNTSVAQSLLSLSMAAGDRSSTMSTSIPAVVDNDHTAGPLSASLGSKPATAGVYKHRRLSSIGQSKRRISDAREATSRPSPVAVQTAASALSSLAASLSPPNDEISERAEVKLEEMGISVSTAKTGKKRGTIFKCECCSKVYRHPSCLVKHRWEHSPHWRDTSKSLLSKHQQVQLLEAAAILSHLSPTASGGTSLPEDRALWPSYLSGGTIPLPSTSEPTATNMNVMTTSGYLASSSVPSTSHTLSSGPKMHEYAVSDSTNITHLRPGVVGVPTSPRRSSAFASESSPVPIMANTRSTPWSGSSYPSVYSGRSYSYSEGCWSIPDSSVRSGSSSLPTDDEAEELDADDDNMTYSFASRKPLADFSIHTRDEDWDEMDMDM